MGTTDRRNKILKALLKRRFDTISNLAYEFGVSDRTVRRDIEILSLSEPLYTQSGRYGGGVYVTNNYGMDKPYISREESDVLKGIVKKYETNRDYALTASEIETLKIMANIYTMPT